MQCEHKFDSRLRVSGLLYSAQRRFSCALFHSGTDYPVHPIDLTYPAVFQIGTDNNVTMENVTVCLNTYQYLTLDPADFSGFDAVFGDAFLRNAYASCVAPFSAFLRQTLTPGAHRFNYGAGGDTAGDDTAAFVQLVSRTTLDAALPPPPSTSLNTRARAIRHDARRQDSQTPSPIRQRRQDPASTECMDPLPLPPVQGAQEESG